MTATTDNTAKVTTRRNATGRIFDIRFTDYRTGRRAWVSSRTRKGVYHIAWHKALHFINWDGQNLEAVR